MTNTPREEHTAQDQRGIVSRHDRETIARALASAAGRGEVELDFSEAEFTNDKLTVDARPNLSDIELIVPEGHAVTTEEATPGTEPVHDHTTAPAQQETPHIHVVARAGMGSIVVRHPRQRRKLFGRF